MIVLLTDQSWILSFKFMVFVVAVLVNIERILSKFGLNDKSAIFKSSLRVSQFNTGAKKRERIF